MAWVAVVGAGLTLAAAAPSARAGELPKDFGASSFAQAGLPEGASFEAPSGDQLADAKRYFDAGLKLHKEQLYREALASFIQAYRLAPRETSARNIAQSYRDLKDMASAHNAYEELLNRFGSRMKAATRNDTEHALAELENLTGLVRINVDEPGATITVDGHPAGTTRLDRPLRLNLGEHQVTVAKEGFEPLTREVSIHGRDTLAVDGPLVVEVQTGHVSVTGTPLGVVGKVLIDQKENYPLPWEGDLPPGPHTFEGTSETGLAAPRQTIEVVKKSKLTVTLNLVRPTGTVRINATPTEAVIRFDGTEVGQGSWEAPTTVGKHRVDVASEGYVAQRKVVLVHAGEQLTEDVDLVKNGASAPEAEGPHDYRGVYTRIALVGLFPVSAPSNDIAQGRGLAVGTQVSGSGGAGGALDVRVGYSFGFIGLEGAFMGGYDHSAAQVNYAAGGETAEHSGITPRTEAYDFHRFGGALDAMVRLKPKTDLVRPTAAIGGGVSVKGEIYRRTAQVNGVTTNSYVSSLAGYAAPNLMFEAGLEIGNTPGTRFYVGMIGMLEFAGGAVATPGSPVISEPPVAGGIDLANGVDFFLGPVVGVTLGE